VKKTEKLENTLISDKWTLAIMVVITLISFGGVIRLILLGIPG